ncbi:MAG: lytic transglycosylase domain-containing protein [Proteobacteria bacterium]|nr:lytic transglycosylase domain-containing protein [Pseudomonadota bacterium]MBU1386365.1 lytic transglycosylase domain-containing protein [Pseudomonadota bacterium]MBU1544476.1 lytic transglycosylase domain-containing protein [Pseudomonadota bacterium]MBU2482205.1 lytic transglycosylase domain-containing protein [Pseudomonadota bacterium]
MLKKAGYFILGLWIIFYAGLAAADIYTFIDSDGVLHFTNVPTSSDYKLYIRESVQKNEPRYDTQKFDDIIRDAQKKYGVEFSLIKAVIMVESGFNPKAVSRVGATGLMQIMPTNYESLSVKDPFNPMDNIMGGALYLQRLLRRYEYKLPLALAAYNAGPDAVDRYKQIPPYTETQNYVKKVMKTYSRYKNS